MAGIELKESSYDYQHSLDQGDLSDFQEFSNMQYCSSRVLPTMEPPATRRVNVSQSPLLCRPMVVPLLTVVGETCLPLIRHGRPLTLEALVVEDLEVDILAGTPFMAAKHEIIIAGCDVASYGCSQSPQTHYAVRACHLPCAPKTNTTVWPVEFLDAPSELLKDVTLAIEPCMDSVSSSHLKPTHTWPQPDLVQFIGGKLRLLNNTEEPLLVHKNDHLYQAHLTVVDSPKEPSSTQADQPAPKFTAPPSSPVESIHVDPDSLLSPSEKTAFITLLKEFELVFHPRIHCWSD